jgi:putative ABC transport system permease protein
VGVETDLGTTRVEVVGEFTIGTGYGADGMLVMSEQTFLRVQGNARPDQVNLGLLKLRPGTDPRAVADALRARLRADLPPGSGDEVRVLTREEMERQERDFWVHKTSVGKIFYIGVVVALVVGAMFVYQVISGDITNRFREYATLKAIGYSDLSLAGLVCRQAVVYGLLGYLPGLAGSLALYEFVASRANLPMAMTWQRCLSVLGMALTLCVASGLLALGKVRSADPVDLF